MPRRGYPAGLAIRSTGNSAQPMSLPAHDGCCRVAPLPPQRVHRADCRSISLSVSAPHLIISGASATGASCRQRQLAQWTQVQQQ
jgi:hypothetical protein